MISNLDDLTKLVNLVLKTYFYVILSWNQLIPDLIDNSPSKLITVRWSNGSANLGNELYPAQLRNEPTVYWEADPNSFYTLIFTDPDAAGSAREYLHWLVVNIPGNNLARGTAKIGYMPSRPPQGSGVHRYVLLVYKQTSSQNFDSFPNSRPMSCLNRRQFNTRKFLNSFNLTEIVSFNFYRAQYDNSIPSLLPFLLDCN